MAAKRRPFKAHKLARRAQTSTGRKGCSLNVVNANAVDVAFNSRKFVRLPSYEASEELKNTPERNLWCAVLFRAMQDASDGCIEAIDWVTSTRSPVGSFVWVCTQLDINEKAIRKVLLSQLK